MHRVYLRLSCTISYYLCHLQLFVSLGQRYSSIVQVFFFHSLATFFAASSTKYRCTIIQTERRTFYIHSFNSFIQQQKKFSLWNSTSFICEYLKRARSQLSSNIMLNDCLLIYQWNSIEFWFSFRCAHVFFFHWDYLIVYSRIVVLIVWLRTVHSISEKTQADHFVRSKDCVLFEWFIRCCGF